MSGERLFHGFFQRLGNTERDSLGGRDVDDFLGLGVDTLPGFGLLDFEDSESGNQDLMLGIVHQSIGYSSEHSIDGGLGILLG